MEGLDDEVSEEYIALIAGILIPQLMRIADKHNIDRDSIIKFTAYTFDAMSRMATFKNWKEEK
jgi:hypothetical protein